MLTRIVSFLLVFMVATQNPCMAWAQGAKGGGAGAGATSVAPFDARDSVGTILLAGLVGGILGLSTLSFYDKPQDNIRNIMIGAGAGMMIVALTQTFQVASSTKPGKSASLELPKTIVAPELSPGFAGLQLAHRF